MMIMKKLKTSLANLLLNEGVEIDKATDRKVNSTMDEENNSNDGIAKNKMGEEECEKESEDLKGKEISPGRDDVDQTEMERSCSINNGDILPHDDTSNSSSGATSDVQCNMCNSQFSTVYTLDSHFKQSHPSLLAGYMKKKYCHFCEIFLRSKQRLEQHLRVHRIAGLIIMGHTNEEQTPNEVKPCRCNMCEYKTDKNANLKRHVLAKHIALIKKPLKCDFCNFETVREYVLQNHMKVEHMKEANIKCKYCGSTSTYIKYKTNIKHFKCDECTYRSAIKKKLVHIKTKHSDEKPYKCNLCDFKTAAEKYLLTHMTKHRVAKCSQCEYHSTSENDLIDHMRTHFGCHLCQKQFKAMFFLKRHLSTCHAKELLFKCSVCDYKTSSRKVLNRHKNIHTLEKVVKCDLCGYKTFRKDALQRHLLACHTREEIRFKCTKCDFKSSLKNSFNRHLKTHTQKKQLECDLCGYKTVQKKLLIDHIKIHSKEYNCKLCQFKTNERKSLIYHMHSHTEKKLFQCNLCEYSAQFNSWLKRHMMTH